MSETTEIVSGSLMLLNIDNIDTDQIIPKEFLTGLSKAGLGKYAFYHWRFKDEVLIDACILNAKQATGPLMLLAGRNFGCGSSREHAVWALKEFGINVIFSTKFADIFLNNCIHSKLLAITVSEENHKKLLDILSVESFCDRILVDVNNSTVLVDGSPLFEFDMSTDQKREYLRQGDYLDVWLHNIPQINAFREHRAVAFPWM